MRNLILGNIKANEVMKMLNEYIDCCDQIYSVLYSMETKIQYMYITFLPMSNIISNMDIQISEAIQRIPKLTTITIRLMNVRYSLRRAVRMLTSDI